MKNKSFKTSIVAAVLLFAGCASITPTEGVLLTDAVTLAQKAGAAAATTYGGSTAGEIASAGLNALGSVLEGYIGSKIPTGVVQATPGIDAIGDVAASVISTKGKVTQADADTVFAAAKIAFAPAVPASSGTTSYLDPDNQVRALTARDYERRRMALREAGRRVDEAIWLTKLAVAKDNTPRVEINP